MRESRASRVRRETERRRVGVALAASLLLHASIVALAVLAEAAPTPPQPNLRVYAVNIVSPPPNVLGDPPSEPPAPSSPAPPAPAAPAPAPESAPEPAPPPPPPPSSPPEPRKEPAPPRETEKAREKDRPREEPRRETPPRTDRPVNRDRSASTPSTPRPTPDRPGASNGSTRTTGPGTGRTPATGRNPDPSSPGGEGLSIQSAGMECPSAGYCENIVRQVRRYFRRPEGSSGSAEVCFRILDDGSVDDIEVNRVRGGAVFRLAVSEAVEQAGLRKAFGALPRAFGASTLPVCVDITPQI